MSPMRVVMNAFFAAAAAARLVKPKSNQQIGRQPHQFPADEKQKQAVGDDDAEHGGGEERHENKRNA